MHGHELPTPGGTDKSRDTTREFAKAHRAFWARLIRKIFELDLLLRTCGAEMKIVSFITNSQLVERILKHLESWTYRAPKPFEPAAPRRAGGKILH